MNITHNNKTIGVWNSYEREFTSHRRKSKHLFKKLNAWGLDGKAFEKIQERGGKIVIIETEEKKRYTTWPSMFEKFGAWFEFGSHGKQIFLPLEYWEVFPS